jgi:dipeptidyl aminopeptidase/acylaminoacyl peptidase
MVLEIHGGPYTRVRDRFSIKSQLMAAAGYAVLFGNPTGWTAAAQGLRQHLHDRFPALISTT